MNPAEILGVREGSIAQRHGLKSGDRIMSINGRPLRDIIDYEVSAVEGRVLLKVVRNGKSRTVILRIPPSIVLGSSSRHPSLMVLRYAPINVYSALLISSPPR
ncbi:MAG: PDZ domain-containing protein [Actinobacteria bacterium]|nr:PDZ domain-containing protein [Actinomycetota bacterium]